MASIVVPSKLESRDRDNLAAMASGFSETQRLTSVVTGEKQPPSLQELRGAEQGLTQAVKDGRKLVHSAISSHHDQVSRHVATSKQLAESSVAVRADFDSLRDDFDPSDAKSTPALSALVDVAVSRSAAARQLAVAQTTCEALRSIQARYTKLRTIEDGIWSGKGGDQEVLQDLHELLEGLSKPGDVPARIISVTHARCVVLRSMVIEQLTGAWSKAVVIKPLSGPESTDAIEVKRTVQLSLPTLSRTTISTQSGVTALPNRPRFTMGHVYESLAGLDALPGLLRELQNRLLERVIQPLVDQRSWRPVSRRESDASVLRMDAAAFQDPSDLVASVKAVLEFAGSELCPESGPASASHRARFLLDLQRDTSSRVLERVLLPAMPISVAKVPGWLKLVRQSTEYETELGKGLNESGGPLESFVANDVGPSWLKERRERLLQAGRRLVYQRWSSWDSREEELPKDSDDSGAPALAATEGMDEDPAAAEAAEDDGWGFDDGGGGGVTEEPQDDNGGGDDGDDGWGFGDDEPVIQPLKKPTREAKRLGKKLGAKASREPSEPEIEEPRPATPPPPPPVINQPRPSPTSLVSTACDDVLNIARGIMDDIEQMRRLSDTETIFSDVPMGLSSQLVDMLDFIRATLPVAQARDIKEDAKRTLQLSNDLKYLAVLLKGLDGAVFLQETVAAYAAASTMMFDMCYENVVAGLTVVTSEPDLFVDTITPDGFGRANGAVEQLIGAVEQLEADCWDLVDEGRRYKLVGLVIERAAVRLIENVFALVDITEQESQNISHLLTAVERLDQLFTRAEDAVSDIALHVPHWLKLCYTNQLLGANLVDITYLFENGSLVDFTPAELGRLVRALFADSEKRARLLDKIEAGR